MALTAPQKVTIAEITRETYDTISSLVSSLNSDQEASLAGDVATWLEIRNSHVKLKGGRDGVDFDNARKRAAIFYRVRDMLGLPYMMFDLDGEVLEIFQLEVGSNF